ncbi:DEAD/DEAH box helicase [Myxococcus sp. CA056]|uniref:DEAD/DEAH box helicase n=1 Tax=Myxococcus sp. CA056 TaxID=2741740 RepID=UPI00157AEA9F|nr:DEAD/DEAH box helicase [Myxococcus sp. CA056]NTX14567.1 DEAD/DEAH box helicase [Myxococcus sp. CA056]
MFDKHAQALIEDLPRIETLDPADCRRALSRAYLFIINNQISTHSSPQESAERLAVREQLRQLANTLESAAVFDNQRERRIASRATQAAAFVAAEALSLLAKLVSFDVTPSRPIDPIQDERAYTLIESALLFIIGGYDINASAVVREFSEPLSATENTPAGQRIQSGQKLWQRIKALCEGRITQFSDQNTSDRSTETNSLADTIDATRTSLYVAISRALDKYFDWLRGGDAFLLEVAIIELEKIRNLSVSARDVNLSLITHEFSDTYHLATLLLTALREGCARSLTHGVPPPISDSSIFGQQFKTYINARAVGTSTLRGRPFLWPSAVEYIQECLPGPHRDAVISMPTGSGKSFLAELATVHALARGWVLYLTPTNALAHQVRRDLKAALRPFAGVAVSAFLGGAEYTSLADEEISTNSFIAVMTPEKCALALRLHPEKFRHCALCVFDECHLLNDPHRGVIADILIAQLLATAPSMRLLLMSAMLSNADELAAWLSAARNAEEANALSSRIRWRPSRAARGFIFVEKKPLRDALASRKDALTSPPSTSKAISFSDKIPLGWIASLSGPWTLDGVGDYRTSSLPLSAKLVQKRSKKGEITREFESWKNQTGLNIAETLASRGIPAINFILSSRHHAFGSAERVTTVIPGAVGNTPFPDLIEALLSVADAELGVDTYLRDTLRKGIAVHTSAMLQVEQTATEQMFATGHAKLMIATGTLAQGLNLPAIAVVISGSQLAGQFYDDDIDISAGLTRANELILNGFGRAGRPGFANQGVVILVSDSPLAVSTAEEDGAYILTKYPVLGEPDASIAVRSPVERFLDELMTSSDLETASGFELTLTSLISTENSNGDNAGAILQRTFGGFRQRAHFTQERAVLAQQRLNDVKERFLLRPGVPVWMPLAAMRAGVDFFRAQRMWEAYQAHGLPTIEKLQSLSVVDCFNLLIEVLSAMPPNRIDEYLDEKKTKTPRTVLNDMAKKLPAVDSVPWPRPSEWVNAWKALGNVVAAYMAGEPFTQIGARLFECSPAEFTSKRNNGAKGIPAVFKFIGDIVDRAMSRDAGCFLAINECWLAYSFPGNTAPETLQALPLCIKNGANALDVLAWFRFGYRQRTCAHLLANEFPLEPGSTTDELRAASVRRLRRQWLASTTSSPPQLTDHARTIILEADETPG